MANFFFQDLQLRIQKHTEVETVDLVLKLKDKLVGICGHLTLGFKLHFGFNCDCVLS